MQYKATLTNLLIPLIALLAMAGGYLLAKQLHTPDTQVSAVHKESSDLVPFVLPDLTGQMHNITEWRGKVIVLNFWATWCPPCREEIPVLIKLQEQYAAHGLQVIGIAIDQLDAVRDYRDTMQMDYPILIGERDALKIMTDYGNLPGVLPYSVIIDRNGQIQSTKKGAFTDAELDALLKPLLASAS